jgi:hypothetical protein
MLIDVAVIAYYQTIRINGWVGNLEGRIESEFFGTESMSVAVDDADQCEAGPCGCAVDGDEDADEQQGDQDGHEVGEAQETTLRPPASYRRKPDGQGPSLDGGD